MKRIIAILCSYLLLAPLSAVGSSDARKEGASGIGIPGLSGTTGNDLTVDALSATTRFHAMPNWPRFYFSSGTVHTADLGATVLCNPTQDGVCLPVGVDTNPCTVELPCRGVAKMFDILQRGQVIVVLDPLDRWSTIGAGSDWDGSTGASITGTCPVPAASNGPMTDLPWAFWTAGGAEGDGSAVLDASLFAFVGASFLNLQLTGSCYLGVAGIRTEFFPNAPSTTVTGQAIWDIGAAGAAGGFLVLVGVACDDLVGQETHCVSHTSGAAGIVAINLASTSRPSSDFDEGATCLPTGTCCTSVLDTPYVGCTTDATSQYESNSHMFEVGGNNTFRSGFLVVGATMRTGVDQIVDGVGADPANQELTPFVWEPASAIGYDIVLINVNSTGPAAISRSNGSSDRTHCFGTIFQPFGANATMNFFLGRSNCFGWPNWAGFAANQRPDGFQTSLDGTATGNVLTATIFQNTFKDVFSGVTHNIQFAGDTVRAEYRCNLFDGIRASGGDAYAVHITNSPNGGRVYVDADGSNVYDAVSGSFDVFSLDGTPTDFTTATLVSNSLGAGCNATDQSPLNADPCVDVTDAYFGNDAAANELAGTAVDGDAFGSLASQGACQEDQDCNRLCTVTRTSPAMNVFVPSAVLGARIDTFTLGTHYKNAGGR